MKSGVSLQQMLTEVKRQSESKEDYLIAPNRLRMESYGKEMFLHLSDDSGTELIEPMTITGIAHRQIGTHLRIPAETPPLLDPRIWYETEGRAALEGIVADLSSRGHHSMTVQEDGHIQLADGSTSVLPELHGFPPVGCWEKLKQVFAGDGLAAEETSGKLVLSW